MRSNEIQAGGACRARLRSASAGRRERHGFTLIELLVVVAVIALLISLALPAMGKSRERAKELICMNNMRSLGTAMILYATEYKERVWETDRWLRFPDYNGKTPGQCFSYISQANMSLECPKNKRRRVDSKAGKDTMWGGFRQLDTDYTMMGNAQGGRLSMTTRAAYVKTGMGHESDKNLTWEKGRTDLVELPAVPVMMEESTWYLNETAQDARWLNNDQMTTRHDKGGYITFIDGQVKFMRFPAATGREEVEEAGDFQTWDLYFTGRKGWVQNYTDRLAYGWINSPYR